MNLIEAKNLAMHLMAKHNLYTMGYSFAFNTRKRAAGICNYTRKTVELSKPITELADEKDVIDTILHEIAHALCPKQGHNWIWKQKFLEIGGNGNRCYTQESSLGVAYKAIAKYKGVCAKGHEFGRNRMPKKRTSCHKCSPRFNADFLITWTLNV
jgi:predicted SprT family Zn-dependent metalloprotease